MNQRTLIALLLAMVILFGFQMFFAPKEQPKPATQPQATTQSPTQPAPSAVQPGTTKTETPAPAPVPAELKPSKQIVVNTRALEVTLSDLGGGITSVRLKQYKETVKGDKGKELIEDIKPYHYIPTVFQVAGGNSVNDATIFTADKDALDVTDRPETLTLSGTLTNGQKVRKIYTFQPDDFTIDIKVEVDGAEKVQTFADFAIISTKEKPSYSFKGPFIYNGKSLNQIDKIEKDIDADKTYVYSGFDDGYFAFIWMPQEPKPSLTVTHITGANVPVERLAFGGTAISGKVYFGPKKISILKQLNTFAEKIVDFGWFDVVAKPMLWGMNFVNNYTHNYGLDIILLTILIKIIFYPLSLKSYKSMKSMQKLQPEIAKLREKFKDDKEKLNREMMDIYKRKGINPLGGCLPMVIQIPVFFALYKVLMGAIEFRHAPFMFWINDLSSPEDLFSFTVAGFTVPIRILPLIMGITQVLQQKMTPTSVDPMQEKMMLFMPIIFTVLFWGFPSGLVLYWLVNNVISIAQQYYINKKAT